MLINNLYLHFCFNYEFTIWNFYWDMKKSCNCWQSFWIPLTTAHDICISSQFWLTGWQQHQTLVPNNYLVNVYIYIRHQLPAILRVRLSKHKENVPNIFFTTLPSVLSLLSSWSWTIVQLSAESLQCPWYCLCSVWRREQRSQSHSLHGWSSHQQIESHWTTDTNQLEKLWTTWFTIVFDQIAQLV